MDRLNKRFPRYSRLLQLYPADYRQKYGEQMLQTLADMLDDPAQTKAAVWLRTAFDFPISLTRQQLTYTGGAMKTMPRYIKFNALTGAWMVAPFFVFVTANALFNQRLYSSLVWHPNWLFMWLIVLPTVAIILNLIALLRWIRQRRRESGQSAWRTLIDLRYSWPVLSIAIIGLGIIALVFGHDSVRCIGGNPFQELAGWHQTWQCIQNS